MSAESTQHRTTAAAAAAAASHEKRRSHRTTWQRPQLGKGTAIPHTATSSAVATARTDTTDRRQPRKRRPPAVLQPSASASSSSGVRLSTHQVFASPTTVSVAALAHDPQIHDQPHLTDVVVVVAESTPQNDNVADWTDDLVSVEICVIPPAFRGANAMTMVVSVQIVPTQYRPSNGSQQGALSASSVQLNLDTAAVTSSAWKEMSLRASIEVLNKSSIVPQAPPQNPVEQHCFAVLCELRAVVQNWIAACDKRLRVPKDITTTTTTATTTVPVVATSAAAAATAAASSATSTAGRPVHLNDDEWTGKRMCLFGSLRLGAWSDSSDLDVLVLGPHWLHREHFFERSRSSCGFVPFLLHSLKQRHRLVRNIVYLPHAHVPVIRLVFCNIEVDLLYCQTPLLVDSALPDDILSHAVSSASGRWNGHRTTAPSFSPPPSSSSLSPFPSSQSLVGSLSPPPPHVAKWSLVSPHQQRLHENPAAAAAAAHLQHQHSLLTLATAERWLLHLDAKSAISLCGWRVSETILHLLVQLDPGCLVAYRQTLHLVKRWARQCGVYGQNFGFLGGISWALLVLAAMQQPTTPRRDVAGIWHAFLTLFRRWPWATQAVDVLACNGAASSATAFQAAMTIRTPLDTLHSVNAAFHVNAHTLLVLRDSIERAAEETLHAHPQPHPALMPTFAPAKLFRTFPHYVLVSLAASDNGRLHMWTGWIESQLRGLLQWLVYQPHVTASAPWPQWIPMAAVPIDIAHRPRELWPRQDLFIGLQLRTAPATATEPHEEVFEWITRYLDNFCRRVSQKQVGGAYQCDRMIITATLVNAHGLPM